MTPTNKFKFTIHADDTKARTRHTYKGTAVSKFQGGQALAGMLQFMRDENPPLGEADKITITFTLLKPKKP